MESESKPPLTALNLSAQTAAATLASDSHVNARKRKKTSRACDFCHVNHQPCDNGEPRCSVCEKHNKSCQYNRPQKKRGPAKGYRSTLNSLNESAAAWGAALNLIPTLGPVIESYLKTAEGSRLIRAIKDPKQQDFFIRSWQESGVFRTFFGGEGPDEDEPMGMQAMGPIGFPQLQHPDMRMIPPPSADQKPLPRPPPHAQKSPALTTVSSHSFPDPGQFNLGPVMHPPAPRLSTSVSDIVARDAARQAQNPMATMLPLGFGPDEPLDALQVISAQTGHMATLQTEDSSFEYGNEQEQSVYYHLIAGRQFPQQPPYG